jgi:Calcineurin-like phosphoesterase
MMKLSNRRTALKLLVLGTLLVSTDAIAHPRAHHPHHRPKDAHVFTVAVISDTQNYVDFLKPQPSSFETFKQQTTYLASNKRELNLAFVTHVGDVVQHGDGTNGTEGDITYGAGSEWDLASEAMSILAKANIPLGLSPGNHDYDNYSYKTDFAPLVSDVMWEAYFGPKSSFFDHKPWYGGASEQLAYNPGLSSYQVFEAGNKRFLHISLEMEAGDAALAWAQQVVDHHKGFATIVTTHAYIDPPADDDPSLPLEIPAERIPASTRYLKGSPGGWNDAQGVWEKFIAKNDQIFMVLCGHAWGASVNKISKSQNLRIDLNNAGHPVYQLLTDYQGNKLNSAGGDGWMRLMEFDTHRGSIHFITYSPTLDKYAGEDDEFTFNQAPEFSDFELPMPVQVTSARPSKTPVKKCH